ncbi:MAG: hypothetical protein BWY06_02825 [Candidatus Latescibacteria bacterium ADurb.Bin168]|nr:MAG: hypothetical protein BWY06_02825 [Candidatus Latescibacteria bacterium ADurb.Bin168]
MYRRGPEYANYTWNQVRLPTAVVFVLRGRNRRTAAIAAKPTAWERTSQTTNSRSQKTSTGRPSSSAPLLTRGPPLSTQAETSWNAGERYLQKSNGDSW